MPFPSAGCQTCKVRRIKCDETLPRCKRCIKSQRICQGMRSEAGSAIIHSENSFASGSKKRPRGPRANPITILDHPGINNVTAQLGLVDVKSQAITYFLTCHLRAAVEVPEILNGLFDDIEHSSMSRPLVQLAVSAMALAVFSRTQQHRDAANEASIAYQELLEAVHNTISTINMDKVDDCLIATFLMSRFENVVYRPGPLPFKMPFTKTLQSFSHLDGALCILTFWRDNRREDQPVSSVVKHTRRSMIKSALLRNCALPDWLLNGAYFGEHGLGLEYDRIIVQALACRQRLSSLVVTGNCSSNALPEKTLEVEQLNIDLRNIDLALQTWASRFPNYWCFERHTIPEVQEWPKEYFYSHVVYSYLSFAGALIWIRYYALRLLVNHTRIKVLEFGQMKSDDRARTQLSDCQNNMNLIADGLASSLPFCLKRFKASDAAELSPNERPITLNTDEEIHPSVVSLVALPLSIASSLRESSLNLRQVRWFKSCLALLGKVIGDGVLQCAETEEWLQL